MIKVIAGTFRSRNLFTPEETTEPTKNRVREAIFSSLSFDLPSACCLDLFAGSGALGIEAISRGSKICFFNDSNRNAYEIVKKNLDLLGIFNCDVQNKDYLDALSFWKDKVFNIVFLDPPYALKEAYANSISYLISNGMVTKTSIFVLEYSETINIDLSRFVKVKTYNYGKTNVMILRGLK